jgi:hypothetical protein
VVKIKKKKKRLLILLVNFFYRDLNERQWNGDGVGGGGSDGWVNS